MHHAQWHNAGASWGWGGDLDCWHHRRYVRVAVDGCIPLQVSPREVQEGEVAVEFAVAGATHHIVNAHHSFAGPVIRQLCPRRVENINGT